MRWLIVAKIPSDPHRSHGIPQLKLSTLVTNPVHGRLWGHMTWFGRVDVDFEQDVECCGLWVITGMIRGCENKVRLS